MTDPVAQTPAAQSSLLLIDDDRSLASLIAEYCSPEGFQITVAYTGEEGVRIALQQAFRLLILDVMLPGIDGFEVLKRIRRSSNTPILMLTTRGAAEDRVRGLKQGADDYLPKPFQPEELIARIHSILKRAYPVDRLARFTLGDISLNEAERAVTLEGKRIDLTGAEFHLLKLLLSHPGEACSREELIPSIFLREPSGSDRSIDNLVNNLRRKLGVYPDGRERIKSIRNVGYLYVVGDSESSVL